MVVGNAQLGDALVQLQDEYKTLGEQGVDIHGIIQYTLEEFALGTKFLGAKLSSRAF